MGQLRRKETKKNVGLLILAFGFNTKVLFRFDKLNLEKTLA